MKPAKLVETVCLALIILGLCMPTVCAFLFVWVGIVFLAFDCDLFSTQAAQLMAEWAVRYCVVFAPLGILSVLFLFRNDPCDVE